MYALGWCVESNGPLVVGKCLLLIHWELYLCFSGEKFVVMIQVGSHWHTRLLSGKNCSVNFFKISGYFL